MLKPKRTHRQRINRFVHKLSQIYEVPYEKVSRIYYGNNQNVQLTKTILNYAEFI